MGELIGFVAVAGAFAIPLFALWSNHQKHMRLNGAPAEADITRLTDQVEALQDRVQVLERIVTDGGYDLATQIEALRDARQDSGVPLTGRQAERQR